MKSKLSSPKSDPNTQSVEMKQFPFSGKLFLCSKGKPWTRQIGLNSMIIAKENIPNDIKPSHTSLLKHLDKLPSNWNGGTFEEFQAVGENLFALLRKEPMGDTIGIKENVDLLFFLGISVLPLHSIYVASKS
ncbi:hypothetical protein TNCT_209161 [Trichonephila clavata]|uniref:Uncharacterized protein n=1 Tax=Trichonephila clavata TaxID=2740835 RepID=A0A8X6GC73_TRICU|nr:hypothetical protein TNCT_209161 [Trichonephila clavata]